jgi:hypothetical protein
MSLEDRTAGSAAGTDQPGAAAGPAGSLNTGAQRLCVWCGPFMLVIWVASFVLLSKFIPPPSPEDTRAEVVARFSDHTDRIRLGLVISLFACALLVPFCAVIAAQMRRIEGGRSVLAETQLVSGGLLCVEFLLPFAIWQTALYRVGEWSPETVQMLNDMAWLMFLGIICSACVQVASIGIAVLRDHRDEPVFPRWAGYFNLWVAIMWVPAGWIPFFKHGILAWNGAFAFYIPLTVYGIWFAVMVILLLRAIDGEEREQAGVG